MRFMLTLLGLFAGTFASLAQCNGDHDVAIYNYEIHPSELTIQVGESVSFTNYGGWHSINGETSFTGEDFDNPVPFSLPSSYAWWFFNDCMGTVTFDVPGVYHFEDGVGNNAEHEGMVGTIIVEADDPTTVVDVIVNSAVHNLLEAAVIEADLAGALSGEGPFTVFAPTDDAFLALAGALNASAEDLLALPELADILLYHVVGAQVLSTDLADGATATTLNGADVTVTINGDGIFINDAQVTVADIVTDNGVVHVIDAVLLPPTEPETTTVVDVIVNSDVHNLLEAAVIEADLAGALSGEGPFTVFAPTDDAFLALAGALNASAEDLLALPELADILLYHVVGAQVLSTDLADGATATTLNGADVTVTINGDGIFINDAQVTVADIVTDNGVVHVIDAVLLPPTEPETTTVVDVIVNSDVHNLLEAAVIEADLAGALSGEGPFTVFAPTDDAFLALAGALNASAEDLLALPELADILLYHVVGAQVLSTDLADGATATTLLGEDVTVTINDDGIFINDAQVTVADIVTDNGVVHVIDAVLLPPTEPETTTVVDVIVNSDVHNILEAAVIEADLAGALSGEGPFTVFAPTDDAFAALAEALNATAEDLLALPELADILLYHVVGAQVLSTDLADGATATTLLGEDVTVTINDDGIFINNAQVTVADIVTDNGVVHVIDAVLLVPEPYTVVDVIVNSDVHNILEAAVIEADLAGALSGEGPFTVFAPTDDAFAALAEALNATAEDLLALPELADILLYHVVGAQVLSTDLADGATATTLLGEDVEVSIECDGSIFINDAQVTVADIVTDNGVVHVIDAVLLPPAPENDCADGDCCGEGTVWDAELGQCVVDDDGCPQDVDGDFFISVGDVLSILVYFGHNCN